MEGVASKEDIDSSMQTGLNHPMGPLLALSDLIGNDVVLHIMEVLYEGFRRSEISSCPLLKTYVNVVTSAARRAKRASTTTSK